MASQGFIRTVKSNVVWLDEGGFCGGSQVSYMTYCVNVGDCTVSKYFSQNMYIIKVKGTVEILK